MSNLAINAAPAKRFFVEMLTRDIDLHDAILDLLDNCLDGAMRQNGTLKSKEAQNYKGFQADITFNDHHFEIRDNCGGITRDRAQKYAFRLGRTDLERDKDLPTIGVYGIGMKRAVFKMGRDIIVESAVAGEAGWRVHIDKNWLADDNKWQLELVNDSAIKAGKTNIRVTHLCDGIPRLLSNQTDFERTLKKSISSFYGYIIDKGFAVTVNGTLIEAQRLNLLLDRSAFQDNKKMGISPYVYIRNADGVEVLVIVGLYRQLPNDEEEEQALEGKANSSERAGWTVICNDRVVLYADKSRSTGWGEAGVPQYHTQFIAIAGMVRFTSNDASKLPLTTTKRGIDGNSELYLEIKNYMREGLKTFTDFTNKWKNPSTERDEMKSRAEAFTPVQFITEIPDEQFASFKGGRRFKPKLPVPSETDPTKQIRFSRKISEIKAVSQYLFEDPDIAPSKVGESCFVDTLGKAKS